jgi:predicted O-methyltransferase YrrM
MTALEYSLMSTLASPIVSELLDRLFAAADQDDPAAFARARDAMARLGGPPSDRQRAELMRDVYMPITPDVGRLLYVLAHSRSPGLIVEFGTSYGISGIHLAAALRDAGRGRLVTTELDPIKAERARENFRTARLDDLIEIRLGDAFETLRQGLGGGIELLLLDGWKPLYLPMLKFLEPQLKPGALIVADDLAIAPEALASYVGYVRDDANGYVSVEVPLGDRLEVSARAG